MKRAVQVEARGEFRIWLKYSDGVEGEVDLAEFAGRGVFRAWSDREVFEAVSVDESGAIVWPGQIDLCPDALYLRVTGRRVEDVFPGVKSSVVDA